MSGLLTWLIPGALLLGGGALLWMGLVGRRVNDHPICRKCKRDLFGLPAMLDRCPDCGSELRPGDVLRGVRERRTGLITVGAFIAVPAALWLGGMGALLFAGASANEYKPLWLLARELESDSPTAASDELARRLSRRKLSSEQVDGLAGKFLDHQADSNRRWQPLKGDFIEAASMHGLLSPELWETYVQQGIGPAVKARPVISAGRYLPLHVLPRDTRLGSQMAMYSGAGPGGAQGGLPVTFILYGRSENDHPFEVGRLTMEAGSSEAAGGSYLELTAAQSALRGRDETELTLVMASGSAAQLPSLESRKWKLPIRLVARPEQSLKVIDDAQTIEAVQKNFEVLSLEVDVPDWWRRVLLNNTQDRYTPPQTFEGRLTVRMAGGTRLPWWCYEIFIDDGVEENRVTTVVRERGFRLVIPFTLKSFDGVHTEKVSVILRPDVEVAEEMADVFEICGGEIVFKDVPVKYPDWYEPHRKKLATTAPAAAEEY